MSKKRPTIPWANNNSTHMNSGQMRVANVRDSIFGGNKLYYATNDNMRVRTIHKQIM